MNICDVSEHVGVSIATVSRVLNGSPNVSEKTREKVLRIMNELGYTPNVSARGLELNTIRAIGIMCSDSSDPCPVGTIYYLGRGLCSHGYDAILCCTGYGLDARWKYFDLLRLKRVDVVILAGSRLMEMRAKGNVYIIEAASDLPIMLVNSFLGDESIYSAACDDHVTVYGAASQLPSYGRRRILYVYTSYSHSGVNKLAGYRDILKAEGITPSDKFIRQCPRDIKAARELLLFLHREGLEFGVAIISNDLLATGAAKYAHIAGVSIPRGLNIIGYNNSLLTRYTDPETTSTDSRAEVLRTTTINTLMGVFSGMNVSSGTTIASDLIKRKTTNF